MMQVLLVTGGYNDNDDQLDSTEVMEAGGTWRLTAPLPSARSTLSAAVVNNNIFVFGENILCYINIEHIIVSCNVYDVYNDDVFTGHRGSSYLKDILQYNTASNTWEEVGQMKEARSGHAVAVLDDVSNLSAGNSSININFYAFYFSLLILLIFVP